MWGQPSVVVQLHHYPAVPGCPVERSSTVSSVSIGKLRHPPSVDLPLLPT